MYYSRRIVLVLAVAAATLLCSAPDAAAKDVWTQVRSKNFFLIGNASEKEIRKVGTRLEQFRETFRLLFTNTKVTAAIPTTVVVFKSDSSYRAFKPKRADGKIDNFIAGYFQSGDDVNYITLSTGGADADMYGTIFHEYVHFIMDTNFGKSDVPPWFNEGIAEYYQTFEIVEDQKVKLGLPQSGHLDLLQQTKLMPLDTLFNISNYQLHQTANHSRSIFYAQSWALIHYLIQSGKSEALGRFLKLVIAGTEPQKAFQAAFQTAYASMEIELKRYVEKSRFNYHEYTFKQKLVFDTEMQAAPLDVAGSNAYLGDLLFHINRFDDAEPLLVEALKANPASSLANTTLGMVKMRQRKYPEAKSFLEKAIAGDQTNHLAFYRYAFLLSREGQDEFGYSGSLPNETADKIRAALKKAIALQPTFTESYELFAYVSLVRGEDLDESIAMLQKARSLQPGNEKYALRIAEIYARQNKHTEALAIAEKIAANAEENELRGRAASLIDRVNQMKKIDELNAAERKRYEAAVANASNGGRPLIVRRVEQDDQPTEAELTKEQDEANLRSINLALREPVDGERRVIGQIQKIDCRKRPLVFTVKTPAETFTLTSVDFKSLTLNTFDAAADQLQIGCDANLAAFNALVTYRADPSGKGTVKGSLVAVEFVPANFKIMTVDELKAQKIVIYPEDETNAAPPPPPTSVSSSMTIIGDMDAQRRAMMMKSITDALKKPAEGERREMGFLDRIECSKNSMFFHLRTPAKVFRLLNVQGKPPAIVVFAPDIADVRFDCNLRPIEFPVVFIFVDKPDKKTKSDGEIRSLDFVPKSFVLEK